MMCRPFYFIEENLVSDIVLFPSPTKNVFKYIFVLEKNKYAMAQLMFSISSN